MTAKPLTPEEERGMRADMTSLAERNVMPRPSALAFEYLFALLFATLDAERERSRALHEATEAHAAWSWAERDDHHGITFDERTELCAYAEWLTARALAICSGDPAGEKYEGVPHLIVWPAVYLQRADQDTARALVERVLATWRTALAAPEPTP